ncbi:MAG: GNAT family N-acetyltransferase [Defluviitaleaceae bacterium]|nr:GNAT family N-acetyltransferase [Defluviitaleaceae bacterium]
MYKFSLMNENNLNEMARIQANAYPGFYQTTPMEQVAERITKASERPEVSYFCAYKEDTMVGGFNIWDFEMNMRQAKIKAGGVGSIAVDLAHKKEKTAREIMKYFITNIRGKGANMALLYPFNSAFYQKMGFGFGTLLQQLRVKPDELPGGGSKANIQRLTEGDAEKLTVFYNSRAAVTHGLITKRTSDFVQSLKLPANRIFAYVDGEVRGYISFQFRKGSEESALVNDMFIGEMLFDSPEVFAQLMSFVKSQADQVRYVIINTQDESIINTIPDPRNHMDRMLFAVYQEVARTGLGVMYRICDVESFLSDIADCKFGDLTMNLHVNISDSFVPENNKIFKLKFENGSCVIANTTPDAELTIDIAEFTSLVMGCVTLRSLVKYGKATLSNVAYLDTLSRSFSLDEKPVCLTYF